MITIGCAGFPIPASRYFQEFLFVEVQETHVSLPGIGTLKRWQREAPEGFRFSLLGPRVLSQEASQHDQFVEDALSTLDDVAKKLNTSFVVFTSPVEFAASRSNKAMVQSFFAKAMSRFERVVWECPATWDPDEADKLIKKTGAVVARDPLRHPMTSEPFAYYRLPGPAGYKSRYEDPAIEKLVSLAQDCKNEDAVYMFANVDMFNDAKRFRKGLKAAQALQVAEEAKEG